ncbi:hypothetical protein HU200_067783 [Digitaria exilis]|uniref:Bifunctional inhibitor/plant lipid transfer protein/seed storage helical domain-containing protein n=1 Tax=Digitaria exilis TaxID=1010633 RepID=A0A835A4K0_9POAL|nr:hypothetical protein HU200_067783 [Digitaria exilis]CAB3486411.1 unnamed protein product [Digitaria exilis]
MAIARATAMSKYGAVMLSLLLVIYVSATSAAGDSCGIPTTALEKCVLDVINSLSFVQPACCDEMANEVGCGCVLRDILVKYGHYDPQKPFCPTGTACDTV